MKVYKKQLSLALGVILALSLCVSALAATTDANFSDVDDDAWYAEAVSYVQENALMNGTSDTTFSPDSDMSRAMLVTVLYRAAGSPLVSGTAEFNDIADGAWYADAVRWASEQELVSGYGNGLFGVNDAVSREQIATILWRYADSPLAGERANFSDGEDIADYALAAVDWAREAGIINGMEGNVFSPKSNASRAQVATILYHYMTMSSNPTDIENTEEIPSGDDANILVVYFSVPETDGIDAVSQASRVVDNGEVVGNVEFIARTISEETGGDIFAIETVQTYPESHAELLTFAAAEMEANARPELSNEINNLDQYDVIFLGYPIWNADLPMPLYSFFDQYDLSGKTIIPFTAHGGSGFAGTISTITAQEPNATVEQNGFSVSRNSVAASRSDIIDWLEDLGYSQIQPSTSEVEESVDVLVVYFSNSGNTQTVAQRIADYTNGVLAEIERETPYQNLQSEAQQEINSGAQPEIIVSIDSLAQYDVIFIGYPIWWNEAPAMISTFLTENDLSEKIVAPFCTSASNSIENSLHIFEELAPNAHLTEGLTANNASAVQPWVEQVLAQAS